MKRPRTKGRPLPTQFEADYEASTKEIQTRIKAFEMRARGETYESIAKALKLMDAKEAVYIVRKRLQDLRIYEQEQVEDIWTMDYHGLLAVKLQLQRAIAQGGKSLAANATALVKVHQRIAAMIGYDKPIQVHNIHEGTVNVNAATHIAIDYSRLTSEELGILERILERLAVGVGSDTGREGTAELPGVRQPGVAGTEPVN